MAEDFNLEVARRVLQASTGETSTVYKKAVEAEVEKGINTNVRRLRATLGKLNSLGTRLEKLRAEPDDVGYDSEGKVARSEFSKEKVSEIKQLQENWFTLLDQIDRAKRTGDFSELASEDWVVADWNCQTGKTIALPNHYRRIPSAFSDAIKDSLK